MQKNRSFSLEFSDYMLTLRHVPWWEKVADLHSKWFIIAWFQTTSSAHLHLREDCPFCPLLSSIPGGADRKLPPSPAPTLPILAMTHISVEVNGMDFGCCQSLIPFLCDNGPLTYAALLLS